MQSIHVFIVCKKKTKTTITSTIEAEATSKKRMLS